MTTEKKPTMTVAKVRELREAFRAMPPLKDLIGCARMLGGCGQLFNSIDAFNAHSCPEAPTTEQGER